VLWSVGKKCILNGPYSQRAVSSDDAHGNAYPLDLNGLPKRRK